MSRNLEINSILEIVLKKVPFSLDYAVKNSDSTRYKVGMRVVVPYRQGTNIGFVAKIKEHSNYSLKKLRSPSMVIDEAPLLSDQCQSLLANLAAYYHENIAIMYQHFIPDYLWLGNNLVTITYWDIAKNISLHRLTTAQKKVATICKKHPAISERQFLRTGIRKTTLDTMHEQGLLVEVNKIEGNPWQLPTLSTAQDNVFNALIKSPRDKVQYLFGVTGSGKTHIYLHLAYRWIKEGGQVIWLLPEIGLTPQLITFLHEVLPQQETVVIHSGLTAKQKKLAIEMAASGEAKLVIGTRSAVLISVKNLAGIIMDEEHDASYKQQSGWRYSARGVACMRAKFEKVPILLGSATPSIACLAMIEQDKIQCHILTARHCGAQLPYIELVAGDKSQQQAGIQTSILAQARACISQGGKVLFFLNRRGFAPALWCEACKHIASCSACDKAETYYQAQQILKCHTCGKQREATITCSKCGSQSCVPVGMGTEKLSHTLQEIFPNTPVIQMDRDTCPTWQALQKKLEELQNTTAQIIVATQMLVKSHNIPQLKMVVVLDADKALYSKDFRAEEHLVQQMHQVSGRAGRDGGESRVYIQTFHVDHPIWQGILQHQYRESALDLLEKRKKAELPPYSHQAIIYLAGKNEGALYKACTKIQNEMNHTGAVCFPAMPSLIPKKDHVYCVVLLLQAKTQRILHAALIDSYRNTQHIAKANGWDCGIDIDPLEW
ncbi:MAG: primosomal protein N' [Pseudomonadota bacterium]|nr:primosomal protein N' [Pseudomonadota bacterium]